MHLSQRISLAYGLLLTAAINVALGAQQIEIDSSYETAVRPFFTTHCVGCHSAKDPASGIVLDSLTAEITESNVSIWQRISHQISQHKMPPVEEPQPSSEDMERMLVWTASAIDQFRRRPVPKTGLVRRLTRQQYQNTIQELLGLQENLADGLPDDAVSKDGFTNNQQTLQASPLLIESYLRIARRALDLAIVDDDQPPQIQNFRVRLGRGINPDPLPEDLILGANSLLLENDDFVIEELVADKQFKFTPFRMQTNYRFNEGYQGNDTVRGWREYHSIYHAVFACMRGTTGYPKGLAYETIPSGLLLRPAIPSAELFQVESTYGPKANFKISLRELPQYGNFRVTVTAAKYDDGLLLDRDIPTQPLGQSGAVVVNAEKPKIDIPLGGIYQVDVHAKVSAIDQSLSDATQLQRGLVRHWNMDGNLRTQGESVDGAAESVLVGTASFRSSPLGQSLWLGKNDDKAVIASSDAPQLGSGDFSISMWLRPRRLRQAGILSRAQTRWSHGWQLDMTDAHGTLRFQATDRQQERIATLETFRGALSVNLWQHVVIIVRRSESSQIFVNGYLAGEGDIGPADLDPLGIPFTIGQNTDGHPFRGELDELRIYNRALERNEIYALVDAMRSELTLAPDKPPTIKLHLGEREFSGQLNTPAFLAVRLPAGELPVEVQLPSPWRLDHLILNRLPDDSSLAKQFSVFEQRQPQLGVHLGLRRDCGSTLSQVGDIQTVVGLDANPYVFEGAIANFPAPDVQAENDNYLAGIREIGIRSEFTDGRDMPRLRIEQVEFEGPLLKSWPPVAHTCLLLESDTASESDEYAFEIINRFAQRAFRRPVRSNDTKGFREVYKEARLAGVSYVEAIKDALQMILVSPQFLYLIEASKSPEPEPVDDYELASKLSYLIWNGPPDRNLIELADSQELRSQLEDEISRLLTDQRSQRFVEQFVTQWLSLDKFAVLEVDRDRFPKLTRDVRVQLSAEPIQFFLYALEHNLPVASLIESRFILANETVASYYGLGDQSESGFRFMPLETERSDLGGLLSQAAILAGLSDGREGNPVKRGAWLARKIIVEPPDDPPPNVPALQLDTTGLSLRQRLSLHRDAAGCRECHAKIDPWGFAFEEYDASGLFRRLDETDRQTTLPDGTNINGFQAFRRYLVDHKNHQIAFSVARHLAVYALGRDLAFAELESLQQDLLSLEPTDYRLQDILRLIINSPMFLEK